MNSPDRNVSSVPFAVCAALAAAACAVIQLSIAAPALSGTGEAVLRGALPDPHVLTGIVWPAAVARICAQGVTCVRTADASAFGLVLFAAMLFMRRSFRESPPLVAWSAPLLGGVAFGLSPFATLFASGPLGVEDTATLFIVLLICAGVAGLTAPKPAVHAALAALAVTQDPLLIIFAVVSALLLPTASLQARLMTAVAPVAALVLRMLPGTGGLPHAVDSMAGPPGIAAIGILLFFVAPAVLYVSTRTTYLQRAGIAPRKLLPLCALALTVAAAGMFSGTGDPSPYFAYVECCLLAAFVASYTRGARLAPAVFAVLAGVQIVVLLLAAPRFPAAAMNAEVAHLGALKASDRADGVTTCLVADRIAQTHVVIAEGALNDAAHCARSDQLRTRLVEVDGLSIRDWGVGGTGLTLALSASQRGLPLAVTRGFVTPKAVLKNTPTGAGAFSQRVAIAGTERIAIDNFTVLSGFAYAFDCVAVRKGAHLTFAVGLIPGAPDTTYTVTMSSGRHRFNLVKADLPRTAGSDYLWHFVSVPFPESTSCARIAFAVPSAIRRPGVWVTVAGPAIEVAQGSSSQ